MSQFDINKIPCPEIQDRLMDHYTTAGYDQYQDIPLIVYLNSELNTRNMLQFVVSPGGGKTRRVTSLYTPRYLESEISETVDFTCESTNTAGDLETECVIDTSSGAMANEFYLLTDLITRCQSNDAYYIERIAAMLDGVVRRLETKTHAELIALKGGFSSYDNSVSGDIKTISTLQAGGENTSLDGIEELSYTSRLVYAPRLVTFGGNLITKYFSRLDSGCCSDVGVDLLNYSSKQNVTHFNDNKAAAVTQTNGFFGMVPGAAHMLYFNLFGGVNQIDTPTYKQMTVTHGPSGLPIDLIWTINCGKLVLQAGLATTVCAAPTDMFSVGDELEGYNGIMEFVVGNP